MTVGNMKNDFQKSFHGCDVKYDLWTIMQHIDRKKMFSILFTTVKT